MAQKVPLKTRFRHPYTTWLLVGAVVLLTGLPLILHPGSDFGGTDSAAQAAISEIQPGVQPWFKPLWSPPGREIEALLFALQAVLGGGLIGYYFGFKQGQKRK